MKPGLPFAEWLYPWCDKAIGPYICRFYRHTRY